MTDYETVLLAHANGASRVLEGPLLEEGDRFREAGARSCVKNTNTTAPARKIVAVIRGPEIRLGGRTNRERAAGGIGPRRPRGWNKRMQNKKNRGTGLATLPDTHPGTGPGG